MLHSSTGYTQDNHYQKASILPTGIPNIVQPNASTSSSPVGTTSIRSVKKKLSAIKRSKISSHKHRREKRKEASLHMVQAGYVKPTQVRKKHIEPSSSVPTPIVMDSLRVCGPGFTGLRSEESGGRKIRVKEYSLGEVLRNTPQFSFRVQEWDGM